MKTIYLLVFLLTTHITFGQKLTNLLCDYESNPLAVNNAQPELSWNIESNVRGERQTAYQILVASSVAKLNNNIGDLWNSGKVISDQNLYIKYHY
jgi:alpha-L-rhamnosidase